ERHAWQHLGRARELRGDLATAVASYQAAERLGPYHPITGLNVGRTARELWRRTKDRAWLDLALGALERGVRINPHQTDARESGGELALEAARPESAALFLGAVPEGFQPSPAWLWLRAKWQARRGEAAEARATMGQGDRLAARVEAQDAEAALRAGKLEEAVARARAAIKHTPGLTAAWETLGYALTALGRLREARDCFGRIAARDPGSLNARLNVAVISLNLRDLPEVRRALAAAERIAPGDPEVLLTRARLLAAEGRRADAIRAYEALLTRAPGHAVAAAELARLRGK
ncbi:MAG: tetratricopeptide repeat protein, partial [bacterium]